MTEWWRPLAGLVRRADRHPTLARAARLAYRAAAEIAARTFGTITEVDGVYLTGSLTRPEHLRPGLSDIDLVVAVNVPTLESELALRTKLRAAHRVLHAAVPVFSNLDYVEAGDLTYLRHFGNAWCLDLDRRWQLLRGTNRLDPGLPERAPGERDLMRLTRCVKRWIKASPPLLALSREDALDRQAERLLIDVVAGFTDGDRLSYLHDVLDRVRDPDAFPALRAIRAGAPPTVDLCLVASLEVLDHWARMRASAWRGEWVTSGSISAVVPDSPVRAMGGALLSAGFQSVAMLTRGHPIGGRIIAAVAPDEPPRATVARGQVALRDASELRSSGFEWARLPVVLTPALWRAAALLAPEPFVGAAASQGPAWSLGGRLPQPPAPPAEDLAALVRATGVRLLLRRLVRSRRDDASWLHEQTFELRWMHEAVARFERHGVFDLGGPIDLAEVAEREAIRFSREWMVGHRRDLEQALTARAREWIPAR